MTFSRITNTHHHIVITISFFLLLFLQSVPSSVPCHLSPKYLVYLRAAASRFLCKLASASSLVCLIDFDCLRLENTI